MGTSVMTYLLRDMLFPSATSDGTSLRASQCLPSLFALIFWICFCAPGATAQSSNAAREGSEADRAAILHLDDEYQAAVKRNDAATMSSHLGDDYVLISSSGKVYLKPDMLAEAKSGTITWEIQDDTDRTVRFYGPDTAVLTGKLHEKGAQDGKPFDVWVAFSDLYVRRAGGWKYVYAHASRLPENKP